MRWLVAPDSFKGTLGAREAASAMAAALRDADPDAHIDLLPIADGGEGTLDVFLSLAAFTKRLAPVQRQDGAAMEALWAMSRDGTAVVESARCLGLTLLPPARRTVLQFHSAGLGQMLREALGQRPGRLLVGLGGSGTNDCGYGMAAALGCRFFDASGKELPAAPSAEFDLIRLLKAVRRVEPPLSVMDANTVQVKGLTDVHNPLCGAQGATYVFGPQKGVDHDRLAALDEAIAHFAEVLGRDVRTVDPAEAGAGAAGGLGFALRCLFGAELVPGIDVVLDAVSYEARVRAVDFVLTGEGCVDAQSLSGKAISGICRRAAACRVPVLVFGGQVRGDAEDLARKLGAVRVLAASASSIAPDEMLRDAAGKLKRVVEGEVRRLLKG